MNVERILFEEVIKLRPEIRQPAFITNQIEKYLALERFEKLSGLTITDEQIRELVRQFESLYVFSVVKCIVMSEVE